MSEEEDLWDEVGSDTKEEKEVCFLSSMMFLRFGEYRITLPFVSLLLSLSFWIIENCSNVVFLNRNDVFLEIFFWV